MPAAIAIGNPSRCPSTSTTATSIWTRTERAFINLHQTIVTDQQARDRWIEAVESDETACEYLGAIHLLARGIGATKAYGAGSRTDVMRSRNTVEFFMKHHLSMRRGLQALAVVIVVALAVALAMAGRPTATHDECDAPVDRWQSREAVRQMAARQGWQIERVKIDDGCYEVRGTDAQGRPFKAKIDPVTLAVLKMKQRDRERATEHDRDD